MEDPKKCEFCDRTIHCSFEPVIFEDVQVDGSTLIREFCLLECMQKFNIERLRANALKIKQELQNHNQETKSNTNNLNSISFNSVSKSSSDSPAVKNEPVVSKNGPKSELTSLKNDQDVKLVIDVNCETNNNLKDPSNSSYSNSIPNPNSSLSLSNVSPEMAKDAKSGSKKKMTHGPKHQYETFSVFDWDEYLAEVGGVVAPGKCFRQNPEPLNNEFKAQMKLEARDPRNPSTICIATVVYTMGPRISLRLDGSDASNDFHELVDSKFIQPMGTCEKTGQLLQPPLGFQKNPSQWPAFVVKQLDGAEIAPTRCFKPTPKAPDSNYFKVGMKLEAVDKKNPRLILPASIGDVDGDKILISFDGWNGIIDYWTDYADRDLFPVGWCKKGGHPLQPPGNKVPTDKTKAKLMSTPGLLKINTAANHVSPNGKNSSLSPNGRRSNLSSPSTQVSPRSQRSPTARISPTASKTPTSNVKVPASNVKAPTSNVKVPTSNVKVPTSNVKVPTSVTSAAKVPTAAKTPTTSKTMTAAKMPQMASKPPTMAKGAMKTTPGTSLMANNGDNSDKKFSNGIPGTSANGSRSSSSNLKAAIPDVRTKKVTARKQMSYPYHGWGEDKNQDKDQDDDDEETEDEDGDKDDEEEEEEEGRAIIEHLARNPPPPQAKVSNVQQPLKRPLDTPVKLSEYRPTKHSRTSSSSSNLNPSNSTWQVKSSNSVNSSRTSISSSSNPTSNSNVQRNTSVPVVTKSINQRPQVQSSNMAELVTPSKSCVNVPNSAVPRIPPPSPSDWNSDDVICHLVTVDKSFDTPTTRDIFKKHEIDGKAFLLLNSDMMMKYMDIKLGPALKISSIIDKLKGKKK